MAQEPQTAFISYSREDSEFALRLAGDLKAAGAAVWLDQLDIAPGQRWARAVQRALNECSRMLVILSPASADSTNVEDEVAFALEEGKRVIPVLYRDCKIPFRLRPLQRVDFRGDYALGLKRLLGTLPAAPVPEHVIPTPKVSPPSAADEARPDPPAELGRTEEDNRPTSEPTPVYEPAIPTKEVQRIASEEILIASPTKRALIEDESGQSDRQEQPEQSDAPASVLSVPAPTDGLTENEHVAGENHRSHDPVTVELIRDSIPAPARSHEDGSPVIRESDKDWFASLSIFLSRYPISVVVIGVVCAGLAVWTIIGSRHNGDKQARSARESPPSAPSEASWKKQTSGIVTELNSVAFVTPDSGWAVGPGESILHTEDSGETWIKQANGSTYALRSIAFLTTQSGWIVGSSLHLVSKGNILDEQAIILHTMDGGKTWTKTKLAGTDRGVSCIAFPTAQSGWIVGSGMVVDKRDILRKEGFVLHTTDGGKTWNRTSLGGINHGLSSVTFATPKTGWIVGDGGLIFHTQDGGSTWKSQTSGTNDSLISITFATPLLGWAVGDHGIIVHTQDGGNTWVKQPTGINRFLYLWSVAFPTSLSGWAVGNDGVILHTDDGGNTWKEQASGTSEHLLSVAFPTPSSGWAVGDGGTILHYEK